MMLGSHYHQKFRVFSAEALRFLKLLSREPQSAAVLCDRADDMLRDAIGDLGADLQRDLDLGMQQARQMLEHFLTDASGLATQP